MGSRLTAVIFHLQKELASENQHQVINDEQSICFKLVKYSATSLLYVLNEMNLKGYFSEGHESAVKVEILLLKVLRLVVLHKDNIVILRKDFLQTMSVLNSSLNSSLKSSIE